MSWRCEGNRQRWAAGALALTLSAGALTAASGPDLRVELVGSLRDSRTNPAGWVAISSDARVAPGDLILYRVDLSNAGEAPARNPVALGPVPAGTAFVPGTASREAGARVDYSIDGGKSFAEKPTIVVRGEDGKTRTVPAPPDRYTTVRWKWQAALAAGARTSVSYQVRVR